MCHDSCCRNIPSHVVSQNIPSPVIRTCRQNIPSRAARTFRLLLSAHSTFVVSTFHLMLSEHSVWCEHIPSVVSTFRLLLPETFPMMLLEHSVSCHQNIPCHVSRTFHLMFPEHSTSRCQNIPSNFVSTFHHTHSVSCFDIPLPTVASFRFLPSAHAPSAVCRTSRLRASAGGANWRRAPQGRTSKVRSTWS